MTLQAVGIGFGIVVSVFTILFALAKIGQYVLQSFHSEHVAPVIQEISHTIKENTGATSVLTRELEITNENAKTAQAEAQRTFDRMGQIIDDHEGRITQIEKRKPTPRRRAS